MSAAYTFGVWERLLLTAVLAVVTSILSMVAITAAAQANGGADPEFARVMAQATYGLIATIVLALWGRPATYYSARGASRLRQRFIDT